MKGESDSKGLFLRLIIVHNRFVLKHVFTTPYYNI